MIFVSCATNTSRPPAESTTEVKTNLNAHLTALSQLMSWQLTGKIAVITPEERSNLYLNWVQEPNNFDFKLTNILGISVARMQDNGTVTKLEADSSEYLDSDAERLIESVTGWQLPIYRLQNWVKGLPDPVDQVILNDMGLIATIKPGGEQIIDWKIEYENYRNVNAVDLPHRVKLSAQNNQIRIIINISKWKLN